LAVTKTDWPDPAAMENPLTYTIAVVNNGPSAATGVTLTDTLPLGVTFSSATSSRGAGCDESAHAITCTLGIINSTDVATVTIVVTPTVENKLTNIASVKGIEPDPDTVNNTDTEITTVGQWEIYLPLILRNR